jgi:hypothetical protein
MSNGQTMSSGDDALDGVSGLGAARKALLHAAGVTTRAELAQMDPERLMRVARMPRHQAVRTLASLNPTAIPTAAQPSEASTADSLAPQFVPETTPQTSPLHSLTNRLRALQGEPIRAKAPRLVKPLSGLMVLMEGAPEKMATLGAKQQRRAVLRLTALVDRLEKAILSKGELTSKREQRLRERLREERRALVDVLGNKPRRSKPKKKSPA